MKAFTATYEVDDGYAGGRRQQHFDVGESDVSDIPDDATDAAIRDYFEGLVQEDFDQRISWMRANPDEFLLWVRDVIARRKEESE